MERIVRKPLKIDFHIHSEFSRTKDSWRDLKNSTIGNVPTLIQKLKDNEIDAIAITDHDFFSYKLYSELKKYEASGDIKKVFPGVEFSVLIKADDGTKKEIHVVAVFDDKDEDKVKAIEKHLKLNESNKPDYDTDGKHFSQSKFEQLLADIDLDVVLIAHQKNSVDSESPREHDVSTLGSETFDELLFAEYFDALEFKSAKQSIFHRILKQERNKYYDFVKFVTGSDCHDWSIYPKRNPNEDPANFRWTYLKCLPSFRGLKMAFTDNSRINTENAFFQEPNAPLNSLNIRIKSQHYSIPMSARINVIIGDNSVGKSALLHALTDFSKFDDNTVSELFPKNIRKAYQNYLDKERISIDVLNDEDLFCFDAQGEIRYRSSQGSNYRLMDFATLFPHPTDPGPYLQSINNVFGEYCGELREKLKADLLKTKLNPITLIAEETNVSMLSLQNIMVPDTWKKKIELLTKKKNSIEKIELMLDQHVGLGINQDEEKIIGEIRNLLKQLKDRYQETLHDFQKAKDLADAISNAITNFSNETQALKSADQHRLEELDQNFSSLAKTISELLLLRKSIDDYHPVLAPRMIEFNRNDHGNYKFLSLFKNRIKEIDTPYLKSVIDSATVSGKSLFDKPIQEIDSAFLQEVLIKGRGNDFKGLGPVELLEAQVQAKLNSDFENENVILNVKEDDLGGNSSGLSSVIYFDLIKDMADKKGIYIVDQPEDDVSQTKIKSDVLEFLKTMAARRQIIIVTHNPLFVVNLDVDNVIYLSKKGDDIKIEHGALEYKDEKTDILDIVAKNLDGGVEAIRARWRKYEKRDPEIR